MDAHQATDGIRPGELARDTRRASASTAAREYPRANRTPWLRTVRNYLPRGQTLTEDVWYVRHHTLGWLLRAHVLVIFVYALIRGRSPAMACGFAGVIAFFAFLASTDTTRRRFVSAMTALGLVVSSAVLVELSGGLIEMHFHFFLMVSLLTLYQDWMPFLIAIAFVLIDHAVVGAIDPRAVYDHQSAINHPFEWALIHAGFLLAACVASVVAWKMNEEQAFRDALTKLPNRALFQDRLSHAVARADRGPGSLAVLFIDLDGFKDVNDTLGHAAGDQLLCGVAERLQACLRAGDTVARLGGDEFAVLLENTSGSMVRNAADRILESLDRPLTLAGIEQKVAASVGIAYLSPGDQVDDLMRNADVAMYAAKAAGRGQARTFAPIMHTAIVERIDLERDLRHAAERGELVLLYQPLVALSTGLCSGVEALVRWQHPTRGLLPPSDFINLAEETGAIVPIGTWVLHEACRQASMWRNHAGTHLTVSVNLSPVQISDPGIVEAVVHALDAAGLAPTSLVLEITEALMLTDTEFVQHRLEELKALGVGLAIDDFGTGYSSLEYLRRLPVDILKIDKSFIDRITDGPRDLALVGAIITLAHTLGLTSVAEGVESPEQVAALGQLGCNLVQGFVYSRPLAAAAVSAIVDRAPAAARADIANAS
jgi:diguanylate cyclase (GGDEF)-like protein